MHPNHGTPLWVVGHRLVSVPTTGDYALADVELTPGVPGPPPHHHEEADELYYVVDGAVEFFRDGAWHTVRRGERFLVPKGTPHSFRPVEGEPGRFLTIHDPGGPMDALFLEHGVPADEPGAFERSVSDERIAAFGAAAADHDMIIAAPEAAASEAAAPEPA